LDYYWRGVINFGNKSSTRNRSIIVRDVTVKVKRNHKNNNIRLEIKSKNTIKTIQTNEKMEGNMKTKVSM